jgi:hypothetical protein
MTTTMTTSPAGLVDAIRTLAPADVLDEIDQTTAALEAIYPQVEQLATRARALLRTVDEIEGRVYDGPAYPVRVVDAFGAVFRNAVGGDSLLLALGKLGDVAAIDYDDSTPDDE